MTTRDRTGRLLAVLTEHAALTRGVLERYLREQISAPYLGPSVAEYPRRGGRMLSSALFLLAVRACGGRLAAVLNVAVALELVHNALLVHHDVADGGRRRRGGATMNRLEGMPLAINTGDALTLLGLRSLLDCRRHVGPRRSLALLRELERVVYEGTRGWTTELAWRRNQVLDLDMASYLEMVLRRTCWPLVIGPLRMGVSSSPCHSVAPHRFVRLGFFWGAAHQIREEVANLVGNAADGREPLADLWAGKRTLPLAFFAARAAPDERARLAAFLACPRQSRRRDDVDWIRRRLDVHACLDSAVGTAGALAGAALHEAEQLTDFLPPGREQGLLIELALWTGQEP